MASRFYFPEAVAAEVNPGFAAWGYQSEALRRKCVKTKGASAITLGAQIGPWTAGQTALDRQYVSGKLQAGAVFTSGNTTVKLQVMTREYANLDNSTSRLCIKVASEDGGTIRATLLALGQYGPATEYVNNATHRNKTFADGDTVTASYTTVAGDRLVIEIGHSDAAGTTPEASCKWGENATDLPVNETQTTDGAGWVEFSNTIDEVAPTIHPLAGITSGLGVVLGVLAKLALCMGLAVGQGTALGAITATREYTGATAGQAVTVGALVKTSALAGLATGQGNAVGDLTVIPAGVVHDLGGQAAGQGWALGLLSRSLLIAGDASGQSEAQATLLREMALAGATSAQGAASGDLTMLQSLAAASVGQSSGSAALAVVRVLEGAAVGESTGSGALSGAQILGGSAFGLGITQAEVVVQAALAGVGASQGTAFADLTALRSLGGITQGEGLGLGALSIVRSLQGAAGGQSAGASALSVQLRLEAFTTGLGTAAAAIMLQTPLAGVGAGIGSASGSVALEQAIKGMAAGQAQAAAALSRCLGVGGAASGRAEAEGALTGAKPLFGETSGIGWAMADLMILPHSVQMHELTAVCSGQSTATGSAVALRLLSGSAAGVAAVNGALTVWAPVAFEEVALEARWEVEQEFSTVNAEGSELSAERKDTLTFELVLEDELMLNALKED